MSARAAVVLAVTMAACKGKATPAPTMAAGSGSAVSVRDGGVALGDAALAVAPMPMPAPHDAGIPSHPKPVLLQGAARADLDAFVAQWLAAQNTGDFAAYQAFYASDFHGIRRTGAHIHKLDRASWMAERAAMFKHPMVVKADSVVAWSAGARRQVFFLQTWTSGSFRDVGTKSLVVTGHGAQIRIAYEELLQSKVAKVAPPAVAATGSGETTFGLDRAPTIEGMRLARVAPRDQTWDVLIGHTTRSIAWVDPHVMDKELDPQTGHAATAIVDGTPPDDDPLAKLAGVGLTVLDDKGQPFCDALIESVDLRYSGAIGDYHVESDYTLNEEPDEVTPILENAQQAHDFLIVANLRTSCIGPWVRTDGAKPLPPPPVATTLPASALASLAMHDPATQRVETDSLVVGDDGFALVELHTTQACDRQESYTWTLYRVTHATTTPAFEDVATGDGDETLIQVMDVDGDGTLDVITDLGAYVARDWQSWNPDLHVYFPGGLGCASDDPEEMQGD